jgi:hypothetical protein
VGRGTERKSEEKGRVKEEGREREGQGVCWAELERVGEQSLEGGTGQDYKVLDSRPMPCMLELARMEATCDFSALHMKSW